MAVVQCHDDIGCTLRQFVFPMLQLFTYFPLLTPPHFELFPRQNHALPLPFLDPEVSSSLLLIIRFSRDSALNAVQNTNYALSCLTIFAESREVMRHLESNLHLDSRLSAFHLSIHVDNLHLSFIFTSISDLLSKSRS